MCCCRDKFGKVTYFGISVLMIFTIYNYSKFIQKFFESYDSYKKIWIPMAFQNWNQSDLFLDDFEINNNGPNVNLLVNKSPYIDIPENKLKTILFFTTRDMEEAFGFQKYDFGEGHQIFKTNLCPDPRCFATANRTYLKSVEDFDAVIIHQRAYNVCIYKYFNNKNSTTYLTIQ